MLALQVIDQLHDGRRFAELNAQREFHQIPGGGRLLVGLGQFTRFVDQPQRLGRIRSGSDQPTVG